MVMKYGNRIAWLRAERGLTQEGLAEKVSISRASLSHYENDRREPDLDVLSKLADCFGVTLDYLMGRTHEPGRSIAPDVQEVVESLELSDEAIYQKIRLTVDGRELMPDEARRFIAFIRAERQMQPGD
jgi:transcriptional regulator with XRE-family HTH domain